MTLLAACSGGNDSTGPCPRSVMTLPLEFVGDTFGSGRVSFEPAEQHGELKVTIELFREPPDSSPRFRLSGPGSCRGGVVRARFVGGDSGDDSQVRVLGARLEGLLQPQLMDGDFFASWSAQIVEKESREHQNLRGYVHTPWAEPSEAQAGLGKTLRDEAAQQTDPTSNPRGLPEPSR